MKKQITHTLFAFIALAIGIGVVGCSSDETKTKSNDVIAEVLQPVTDAVAEVRGRHVPAWTVQTVIPVGRGPVAIAIVTPGPGNAP